MGYSEYSRSSPSANAGRPRGRWRRLARRGAAAAARAVRRLVGSSTLQYPTASTRSTPVGTFGRLSPSSIGVKVNHSLFLLFVGFRLVCLFVCLSVALAVCFSVCAFVYLSVCVFDFWG